MDEQQDIFLNRIAIIGLAIGAVLGVAGSIFDGMAMQNTLYGLSSIGLTTATVLLGLKYFRSGESLVAGGFFILAIAEGVMHGGTAAGDVGAQPSFAAGMSLYVPALLLISIPKFFPLWMRLTGVFACVPFGIAAGRIFLGHEVLASNPLPGAGYGLLVVTIIGWIIMLSKNKVE